MNPEEKIRELLNIGRHVEIYSLETYEKFGKTYYRLVCYDKRKKDRGLKIHVPRKLEPEVLSLWKECERLKNQGKEIKETIEELLRRFQNPELIRKAVEELLDQGLKREAKDFAYERYKNQALKLFEELKPYLLELKKNKVNKISLLQAL